MKKSQQQRTFSEWMMHTLRFRLRVPVTVLMLGCNLAWTLQSNGEVLIKTNSGATGSFLAPQGVLPVSSYNNNAIPTINDLLLFRNDITAASNFRVSNVANANLSVQGLKVLNPAGAITIQNNDSQNQTLTIGSGGIDLSQATQNLTLSNTTTTNTLNLALSSAQAATWSVAQGRTLTVAATITGASGLTINPGVNGLGGTVLLGGTNSVASTFTGATTVNDSALILDYTTATNRIHTGSALTLNRGALTVQGGTTFTQAVAGLNVGAGLSSITRGGTTASLNVGAITRTSPASVLNLSGAGFVITSSANVNGILGGWGVIAGTDWAVGNGGAAAITSYTGYTDKGGAWGTAPATNANLRVTSAITAASTSTINSLKFNSGALNFTQTGGTTLTITSGGILKNDNNATVISGGSLTAGAADAVADSLYIWNSQNAMTISSNIVNNGTDVLNVVASKAGTVSSEVVLSGTASTYTGSTTVANGRLTISNPGAINKAGDIAIYGNSGADNTGSFQWNTIAATLTGNITGAAGNDALRHAFRKLNSAALTLTPTVANTYSGSTLIEAGALRAGNTTAFSPNSRYQLSNVANAVLDLAGFNNSVRGLTGGGTTGGGVNLGSGTLTLKSLPNDALSYAGIISGTGGLIKDGEGTQTFTTNQTFTGGLTVNKGVLDTLALAASGVTVSAGGTLLAGNLAASSVTVNGDGLVQMKPGAALAASTVTLNGNGATLQLANGATQNITSLTGSVGSRVVLTSGAADSNVTLNDSSGTNTIANVFTMSAPVSAGKGNLTFTGGATWELSGGNAHNGSTTVGGGILQVSSGATVEVLPDTTTLSLANVAGAAFNLNGKNETIGSLSGGGTTGGNVTLGTGTLTVGASNTDSTFSGIISGTGGLIKTGSGVMTLDGASTFTGDVRVSGGSLVLNRTGGGTLASTVPVAVQGMDSRLVISSSQVLGSLSAGANTTVEIATGATLTTTQTSSTAVVLKGNGDTDTRVIRLTDANAAATLRPGMPVTGGGLPAGAYITQILSDGQILINVNVPTNFTNGDLTFGSITEVAGTMEGGGNWTKTGNGRAVISGTNNLTGQIEIAQGSLQVGGINNNARNWLSGLIHDQASVKMGNGATLDFGSNVIANQPFERIGSLEGGNSTTLINLGGGSVNTVLAVGGNNATDKTYVGNITGGNNSYLIKEGNGTLTWTSDSAVSMTGTIRVESGVLDVGGSQGVNISSRLAVSNKPGAKLILSTAIGETVSSLSGGGRGTVSSFANGTLGALGGAYLNDGGGQIDLNTNGNLTLDNATANVVFRYGGSITGTGTGGLVKDGPNTLELYGDNTYKGSTVILAAAVDSRTSTLRLGAYGSTTGIGNPGAAGFGSLPSTTNLQLVAGTTGISRNVTFDLNGATQTVSTLISTFDVGTRIVQMRNGTLNINTVSGISSGVFTGNFEGSGTINVQGTVGDDGWTLTGDSNLSQTGALNVQGGKLTLGRAGGTVGDKVNVSVTGTGQLIVRESDFIGSLSGNGTVSVNATRTLTLSAAPSGGVADNPWSGNITGLGGLALGAGASLRLTTTQNYQGGTTLNSGAALYLDYGTTAPQLIPGILNLKGGSLFLSGNTGQTIGSVTNIDNGATSISTALDSSAKLNLAAITRKAGGVLQVRGASVSTTAAANHGILGGYATYHAVDSEGNPVVSWAKPNANGNAISAFTDFNTTTYGSGIHTDVTLANAQEPVTGQIGSLRFNTAAAIELPLADNQLTEIQSGGILVTPAVGPNDITIFGDGTGASLSGGYSSYGVTNELIIHQHNTRGKLTIEANITDMGGDTRLTKTGQGTLVLTQSNSYNGQTSIFGGVLELSSKDLITHGDLGLSTAPVQNYGYLVFNRTDGNYDFINDIIGTGAVRKTNIGTTVLRGANSSYTGPTQVLAGKLAVSNSLSGLGSADGLTSVAGGAILELRGLMSPETVMLHGGTLSAAVSAAGLNGPLYVTQNATLGSGSSIATLTLNGPVIVTPGKTLTTAGAGGGTVILGNGSNQIGDVTIVPNTVLQVGNNTAGSVGRGTITNNGRFVANASDGHLVIGAKINGTGSLVVMRNNVYLTADNTYSGGTIVGGNGVVGLLNQNAFMRVGNDTYTGSLGTGPITIQASTGGDTHLRYHLLRNAVLANNFIINPFTDGGSGSRLAYLLRNGLGSITLTGSITAGVHDTGLESQRAIIQSEGGGKLVIRGTINNSTSAQLNINNNGVVVFDGSNAQTLWGVLGGGGIYVFRNDNTITLRNTNTFNAANYIQRGTVAVNASNGLNDDSDWYLSNSGTLQFDTTDLIGSLYSASGSTIVVNGSSVLSIDDSGLTMGNYGRFTGTGSLNLNANGGTGFYGLFGTSDISGTPQIGSSNQLVTVRVNSLKNSGVASSLGTSGAINLGVGGGTGETRLEYIGPGDTTNKTINLTSAASTFRIAGNGKGALTLAGDITVPVTATGNKTLYLHGQTVGNTISGKILEGPSVLTLNVNTATAANNDMYGLGRWVLTNAANDFSGGITVNLGVLELAGNLGNGSGATSVLGDLSVTRTIDLATANFDGRRFDVYSGNDSLGAVGTVPANSGTILFADPTAGTAVFDKLNFTQTFAGTSNIGSGELINNGTKVLEFKGTFTTTSTENAARSWTLDGTNEGINTISGIISDTPNTSSTTSVIKEGPGTWRLTGTNTYQGATTVARGLLEISSTTGTAIFDDGILNVSNAGSDFSSAEPAVLRFLTSETVGGIQGGIGGIIDLAPGVILTTRNANQTFNGIVSGDGDITRTNNDTNARVTTMTAKSTYNGVTTITTNGTNQVGNRIDVFFLANGGQASGLGQSSSAASNLILNTGTGGGGIRWIGTDRMGTAPQSTDRLFTLGSGTGAGAIWADGQIFGDYAPAISFTNTGAFGFLTPNTTQTLTLRGSTISDNRFSPQITNNGTGATILSKVDGGMWLITNANTYTGGTSVTGGTLATNNSSGFGTGTVTVNGGGGIGVQLRDGVTITNALTNSAGDGGLAAYSGNNTWAGNITLANGNWRLGTDAGASLNLTGTVSGLGTGVRLMKYGQGTLTLSGTMTHTGITNIAGGSVVLNYDTAAGGTVSSKLADGSVLELGWTGGTSGITTGLGSDDVGGQSAQYAFSGGTLVLSGGAAGAHTEIVGSTTINAGANRIIRQGAAATILQMGAINRTTGNGTTDYGTLDLGAAGIATTTTLNTTGGILAPNSAAITVNQTDWATTSSAAGTNAINAFSAYNNNGFGTNQNTNITNAVTTLSSATLAHTIRFDTNTGGTTINLGTNTLSLETGGILVTKNNTDDITINGGTLNRSANTANLDTVIHHHGSGILTINSVIANNTNLQALTKAGTGTVVLNGTNTYTGRVTLQAGITQVGDGTAGSASARLGNGSNTIGMSEGATLRINVANSALEYTPGLITGGGLLHLASDNDSIFTLNQDNANWIGDVLIEGGTLRLRHNGGLGNVRGITTVGNGGTLELSLNGLNTAERITMLDGGRITTVANGATNTTATISAPMKMQNTTSAGAVFDIAASQFLTVSSMIRATKGFTKSGNGTLTLSGNHMQDFLEGAILGTTTPNTNSALLGQIVVSGGDLRLGGTRALGATGAGNETIITPGGSLDLRGQSINYGDDPDPFREIIRVSGSGFNGTGALKNTSGLGVFSHLEIVAGTTTTLSSGGYANGSRLVLAPYDVNPNTGSSFAGNFDRMEATIAGNNANLVIIGSATANDGNGAGVTFRDPKFLSALNTIYVKEGMFRIEKEAGTNASFSSLSAANITNGITIGYGGASIGDQSNGSLGVGANVGARLNFYRNLDTTHSVNITMDGVTAMANNGYNYIDLGADATAPNPRTYLSGQITLLGDASRNIFHIDAVGATALSVGEQGNLTAAIQSKLIINGQLVGSGGFTKTGVRELRLTGTNTFTGDVNILRFGAAAMSWQDNVVNFNGVNYQTYGDGEGWAEAGVVLTGVSGTLSGTKNINLQRRGLLTLDNTNRLNPTSQAVGGNNNDRINDAANILFNHGWLKIMGGTVDNSESLATAGGAKMQVLSGSNMLDLVPTDGAGTAMTLTIGEIARSPGAVLYINDLDSTSKFTGTGGPESVRVLLNNQGNLELIGANTSTTSKPVIAGIFGGVMPHQYLLDMRQLGYNNSNNSDYLTQGRNQQFITASHFMTWDNVTKVLRPLDDSEYYIPVDGLIDNTNGAAGQNVSLNAPFSIVRDNTSINTLRFGPVADLNGSGGSINNTTTLTGLLDGHNLQLYVDGTLKIESGMISSGYFNVGTNANLATFTMGGTLDFGDREAIINNQNAMINTTAGVVTTGNFEIRSNIAGTKGLTKTGLARVVLDGRNTYSGVTTVSNGDLFLRSGRQGLGAGGEGNGVVIEGNGAFYSGNGIQIGTAAAPENILVKAVQGNQYVFRVDNDLTNFFGNLTIDNVDAAGQALFTPLIRADNAGSAIMNGNITGGLSAISNDVLAIDSRVIQFEGAGNNNFIFRGQFGDRTDANGNALPIANPISTLPSLAGVRTNENEVLRVTLNGAADTNFIYDKQYNAVGRINTIQGNIIINYDPNDPTRDGNGFWTNAAISKIPNADSVSTTFTLNGGTTHQGFVFGTTANNGTASLFMTKPGQIFNMASWNATGAGLKWVGGMNETGTVTYGNPAIAGNLAVSSAALRFYATAGGTVVFDQRISGNGGTAPNSIGIAKVGRGTVILDNTSNATGSDSNFELGGGKLLLDHDGQNVARVGPNNAILNGGVIQARSNPNANSVANYSVTSGTNNVLQIRQGTSEVIAEGVGTRTMTVNIGHTNANNNTATITRAAGGAVNLVEWVNGTGTGVITINMNNFTNAVMKNRAISWATYSNTPREALDFAMINAGAPVANDVQAYARVAGEYLNDVTAWANGMDVSENGGAGFFGTLTGSRAVNTLRFDALADSSFTIGNGQTLSLIGDGIAGGLLVSSNTGSANKTINGGSIAGFTKTYGGTTTSGSNIITGVTSVADLTIGMPITGTGIPTNAYITAINGNSITISANATASGTPANLNTTTADIVIHQYGKGTLNINSVITNPTATVNGILTIAGPSVTTPETYGTTGKVRLTNTANDYKGATHITGAVLEISQGEVLGTNPAAYTTGQIVMNGGALRWTGDVGTLGNRGITFNGNGGLIDVVNSTGNLIVGSSPLNTTGSIASQEIFRGDLIKMGAGTLTLLGTSANFSGLMDVRQGSLVVIADVAGNNNVGTTVVLGSSRSWVDGTILRTGTNFQAFLGNGNNGGDWNIDEFFTFEGGNTFTYGGFLDIVPPSPLTTIHDQLDNQYNLGSRRPLNLNGNIDIKGTTTFDVMLLNTLRLNNGSGYLTGNGDIVKDGQGQLHFRANVPDWTGNLIIKQGSVYASNQADVLGTGYLGDKTITLGDAERAGTAELLVQNPENVHAWAYDINHDINVVYNPAQTKRLGIDGITNSNLIAYNGDITLNDSLILLMRDTGIATGGEQSYVNFNGSFRDGTTTSGNLVVQVDDNNTTANDLTNGRAYGYPVLNGDNSGWTGDITISTNIVTATASGYNQDNTAILRLGNAKALTAANDVTMNYNSILQAGGQTVTIGNLNTQGGTGNFYGDAGTMSGSGSTTQTNGSSEIIENASSTPAVLTISQSTPLNYEAVWDAFFRDGTLNSQFFAPGANTAQPSASLSVTKAGSGWATLSLDNDYTGATVVQAGVLQVGRGGIGDTGSINATGTSVMAGATLAGSGTIQGGLSLVGGILKTGDSAGAAIGTLSVSGSAIFSSGSTALMQIRNASYNNPTALTASDPQYGFWRNSMLTDSFSTALNDLVTTAQHDMLNVTGTLNWGSGTQITVSNEGYTPKAGDIIRLFKAGSYTGTLNVGPDQRRGGETGFDLNLFNLGGNLVWDVSHFLTHGILMVIEADVALDVVPPPSLFGPVSNQSETEELVPGTQVTLTAEAETTGDLSRLTFTWILNGIPVPAPVPSPTTSMTTEPVAGNPNRKKAIYTFRADYLTKGTYTVSAVNEGGVVFSTETAVVQVNDTPDIATDPVAATVNPGATHSFTVTVGGMADFTYQWLKDGEPFGSPVTTSSHQNSLTLTNITEADEGDYSVRVTNIAGTETSAAAHLDVRNPITSVVASVTPSDAYVGQTLQFSVVHDGEGTMTYQWKKGADVVANTASFSRANITTADSGLYTVTVTSPVGPVVSNVLNVVVQAAAPTVVAPPSKTLLSGDPLPLAANIKGRPTLSIAWKKNNAVIANAGFADISKASAAVADGGTYTVEVTNSLGKVNTTATPTEIVVVDSGTSYLPVQLGAAATFTARVGAGPKTVVQYQWGRVTVEEVTIAPGPDGQNGTEDDIKEFQDVFTPLVASARITGVNTKTLKITGTTAADNGIYRVLVKGPDLGAGDAGVGGSDTDLRLYDKVPAFDADSPDIVAGKIVFPQGLIGADYTFQVPVDRSDVSQSPDKITATGLPAGLKVDPISGLITGKPTAVTKPEGVTVTITLANKVKGTPAKMTGTLIVRDLATTIVGVWTGTVDRHPDLNGNLGGRFDLTVTAKATYTGKLVMGATTYSFSGALNVNNPTPTGSVFIKRAGNPLPPPLRVDFSLNPTDNTIASGIVTDGSVTTGFGGWRQIYKAKVTEATKYLGYHTLSLALPLDSPLIPADEDDGSTTVPLGAGYATFTVAADGKLTVAGKMPDGEAVSVATFLGPNGEIAIYNYMYKALKPGGSLLGEFEIDDKGDSVTANNTLSGNATWVRPASTKATDRVFKDGFGIPGAPVSTPLGIVAIGGRYDPPAGGKVVLDITESTATTNNAYVDFIYGSDLDKAYTSGGQPEVSDNPDSQLNVGKASKVTAPKDPLINETKTTLTAAAKTGLITGSFTTTDNHPVYGMTPAVISRSVKFYGVIIRENGTLVGVGFYTMPLLPITGAGVGTDAKTTPNVSGRFTFDKLP